MSKDISHVDPEVEKKSAERKLECKRLAHEALNELNYDLSPSNINEYLTSKNFIIDDWCCRDLALSPLEFSSSISDYYENKFKIMKQMSEDKVAKTKLLLYKFGFLPEEINNHSVNHNSCSKNMNLTLLFDRYNFFTALEEEKLKHDEYEKKQDKKTLKHLKHEVKVCNIKFFLMFICCCVFLFGYPFSLGYALYQIKPIFAIFGFVSFWVHFYFVSQDDFYLNKKMTEIEEKKEAALFVIHNFDAIKKGSPVLSDPNFLKHL